MRHFKFAHIALGTAIFGSAGAVAWLAVLSPSTASGSGGGMTRITDNAAARKPERLSDPLVIVSSDSGSSARSIAPDREAAPTFNATMSGPMPTHHADSGGGGGGGTGNGIAPIFVANAGPFNGDTGDSGSGGADLRGQVGGGGGRANSTDSGGPGGAGPGGYGAPAGGDPGGGGGSSGSGSAAGVMTAATMTTSGNLDVAGGFTDVVPAGGNWTVGQDLNVGSGGTGASTLDTSGAVKVSGSLNVGSANGTSASTVVIGPTGSIAVTAAVNVYANGQLQVNGSLIGAQAVNILGGDAQVNVATAINVLNLTAGQVGGAGQVTVGGALNISGDSVKAITGSLRNDGTALWNGGGNILLGNGGNISNYGTFVVESSGAMQVASNATGANVFVNQAGGVFKADSQAKATIVLPFVNYGQVSVQDATLTFAGGTNGYIQTGISSRTSVGAGGTISSAQPLVFQGGYIKGEGTYAADIENSGATLAAGASPGHLTINGNYSQTSGIAATSTSSGTSGGIFNEQIEGVVPGTLYDVVTITGVATLGGALEVTTLSGYAPKPTDSFMFLEAKKIQQALDGTIFGKHIGDKINVMTDETDTPTVTPTLVGTFTLEYTTNSQTGYEALILDKFVSATPTLHAPATVPEPASLALLGIGAMTLLKRRNRR